MKISTFYKFLKQSQISDIFWMSKFPSHWLTAGKIYDCTIVRKLKLLDFIKVFDSCKNSSLRTFQRVKPLFSLMQDCIIRIERLNKCIAHLFWVMNLLFFMQRGLGLTPFVPILSGCHLPFRFRFKSFEWIIFNFQQNIFKHTILISPSIFSTSQHHQKKLYARFKKIYFWFFIWAYVHNFWLWGKKGNHSLEKSGDNFSWKSS